MYSEYVLVAFSLTFYYLWRVTPMIAVLAQSGELSPVSFLTGKLPQLLLVEGSGGVGCFVSTQ
jgi:hypothetical protein